MTKTQIQALSTRALQAIARSTNPDGRYGLHLLWALTELRHRGETV